MMRRSSARLRNCQWLREAFWRIGTCRTDRARSASGRWVTTASRLRPELRRHITRMAEALEFVHDHVVAGWRPGRTCPSWWSLPQLPTSGFDVTAMAIASRCCSEPTTTTLLETSTSSAPDEAGHPCRLAELEAGEVYSADEIRAALPPARDAPMPDP